MPTLNEAPTVVAAVQSVLDQSFQDSEVLVVDGSSDDGCADLVRQLAAREPRVRLLENPARLIPSALNIGLAHARGRYVARVDAHATVSDTYLERGVATLEADPSVGAVGGRRVGVARTRTGQAIAAALSSPFGVGDSINHYATEAQDTDHASFGIFRADAVRSVGGWDESLAVNEDVDLDLRLRAEGHRIRFDPEMVINWRIRETLRDFGRQYRRYGRGKAAMVLKNGPTAVRPRHLAAPGLVVMLGTAAVAALAGRRRAATALTLPYPAAVALAVTLAEARTADAERGSLGPVRLAASFATMHLAWGIGFLEGLTTRAAPQSSSVRHR
jgi:cellulose synthase/poly-beta-1,6-N-acetylglucosamine synthase-like glycosyltransferase